MPMLPMPTTRTRLTICFLLLCPLAADPDDIASARGLLGRQRRLERGGGVLGPADLRRRARQRATGEIGKLFPQRADAHAAKFGPIGRIRALELFAGYDPEIGERVLDMNETLRADDRHALVDVERRSLRHAPDRFQRC